MHWNINRRNYKSKGSCVTGLHEATGHAGVVQSEQRRVRFGTCRKWFRGKRGTGRLNPVGQLPRDYLSLRGGQCTNCVTFHRAAYALTTGRMKNEQYITRSPVRSGPLTQVGVTIYYCSNRVCERVAAWNYSLSVDKDRARLIRRLNLSLVSASSQQPSTTSQTLSIPFVLIRLRMRVCARASVCACTTAESVKIWKHRAAR